MENRLVLGVDVTNSSVNRRSDSVAGLAVGRAGARGEVFLFLNSADNLSRMADLSFGLNRLERSGFLVDELSVVEGRKEWFLMMDSLRVVAGVAGVVVVAVVVVLLAPRDRSKLSEAVVVVLLLVVGVRVVATVTRLPRSRPTPAMLDKVTSINLSPGKSDAASVVGLETIRN